MMRLEYTNPKIFVILLNIIYLIKCNSYRNVSFYWNPGCDSEKCIKINDSYINFIHVVSQSTNDDIHFIWTTFGVPSFYLFYTSHNTTLDVNWLKFLSNNPDQAIIFNGTIIYKFALFFPNLIETYLNNTKFDGYISKKKREIIHPNITISYNLTEVIWEDFRKTYNIHQNFGILKGHHNKSNTNISFKISFFDKDSRSTIYPHMLYTVNSTEFLLTLNQTTHYHENESLNPEIDNFDLHHAAPSPDPVIFSKPILSLRIVVIESKFPKDFGDDNYFYPNMIHNTTFCMESEDRDPFIYLIKKSIDDEYTPGLFRIDEIISKSSRRQLSGYLQWKPLFFDRLFPTNYRDSKPVSLSQLKSCVVSNQFSNNHSSLNYSLPSFLHSILVDRTFRNIFPVCSKNANLILQYGDMNFISSDSSLGGSNEYDSTSLAQYISWQCVLGYGHPPKDSISFFIILLISFGFGVPLSLVFFAYTFGTLKILKSLRVDGNDSDSKEPSDTAYLLAPDINKDS